VVLRYREQHRNRLDLGYDQRSVLIVGMNDVAHVYQTQADPASDRRADMAVGQLQTSALNLSLIGFDRAFKLSDGRSLGIELLLGNGVLFQKGLIAGQVDLGVVELGLVSRQLTF